MPTFLPSTAIVNRSGSAVTVVGAPVLSVWLIGLPFGVRPWPQRGVGQRGSGQPGDGAAVAVDRAEAGVVVLPLPAVGGDVVVAAADEVPPHDQFLAERRPAEQDRASGLVAGVVQRQGVAAGGLIREIGDVERGARRLEAALVEQHAVLEGRVDVEVHSRARIQIDLRAEQRREGVHR